MLYDFHHKQNKKKPGTLHATYLITGRQKQRQAASTNGVQSQESQGTNMRSSPFPSSSMPEPRQAEENVKWIRLVTLAKEEDLEGPHEMDKGEDVAAKIGHRRKSTTR